MGNLEQLRNKMKQNLKGDALKDYKDFIAGSEDIDMSHFCKYFNIEISNVLGVEKSKKYINILYTNNIYTSMFTKYIPILDEQWDNYLKIVLRKKRREKLDKIYEKY